MGRQLAQALLRGGASVTIVGRDAQRLAEAQELLLPDATGDRLAIVQADITERETPSHCVRETLQRFGRLDALMNCAGRSDRGLICETSAERFRELWELNFLATAMFCQAARDALVESRGHIVNIGSLAAKTAPRYLGAYATSKFPVAALSQQLRLELREQEVHVLLVCPGPIRRDDAGQRYQDQAAGLPAEAKRPGGGARIKLLDPEQLARRILQACERRQLELVMPGKARLLFALSQLLPAWGDWLLLKKSSG